MNLEQMKARLAEIVNRVSEIEQIEELSDAHIEELEKLQAESDTLTSRIKAKQTIESIKKQENAPNRQAPSARSNPTSATVKKDRLVDDPKLGFENAGQFYKDVISAKTGNISETLRAANGANEKIGEDGGYLVPPDFTTAIDKLVDNGDESLVPLTRQFSTRGNSYSLPVSETVPWGSEGIQAFWEGEAAQYNKSKPQLKSVEMKLHKLTALVPVTEELLEDAENIASYINEVAPQAVVSKINNAIISGTGVGQPLGFLNSGFKVKVPKVNMQTADTVIFENVNDMLGRLLPNAFNGAFWAIHPAVWPQLRTMKFGDDSPIYLPNNSVSGSPYGTLYGLPVKGMMGAVKALGDEGDISLINLKYYTTIMKKAGIQQSISTHVYFDTDEVAFKFRVRMAGQCHFSKPVNPENGTFNMSGIVTLEAR